MNIALIGVSHWHWAMHSRGFGQAGAKIVAVCDPNADIAQKVGAELETPFYTNLEDLLKHHALNFTVVMGTPLQMPGYVKTLLEANLPFASEKPLGLNAEVIEPLLVEARQKNLFVAVAFANRYSGVWGALENAGPVSHMHFRIINGSPERYRRDGVGWVLEPKVAGGGVLRNLGIHGVDAFCKLAGKEQVGVVSCVLSSRMHKLEVEDFASLTLRTPSGLVGTLEAGYTFATLAAGGDYEFRIAAQNAYVLEQGDVLKVTVDGHTSVIPTVPTGQRYDAFAKDALERFKANQPPAAGLSDLHRAMQVIDQAYAKAIWV